ncbi:MBL fold metallo-hydrolase [Desulfogranum marinum]|uniref:MBL fold metallo-hydrolase n=1 Tax=Desulfogranum marinum TaxID=453220 RepID=UPI0029C6F169|nr:MBL fold metallo-hydrolase [Desulfogranum marinum]
MQCECTVLCENSVAGSLGFIGEHGWAVHIKAGDKNILFDTGQGLGLIHNSKLLDIDLKKIDAIVISHGHYDHTSGLPDVLHMTGNKQVFLHPDCFTNRYWTKDGECREIGIRYKKEYLESLGAVFVPNTQLTEIADNVFLTGEIPRVSSFEQPDPFMKIKGPKDEWQQDNLLDDQSLVMRTDKGLVIILGCAHAGLINILTHVNKQFPGENIYAVFGGTHLGFADDEQFEATVAALDDFSIQKIGASHCTGLSNTAKLHHRFGERFFFSSVGCRFNSD